MTPRPGFASGCMSCVLQRGVSRSRQGLPPPSMPPPPTPPHKRSYTSTSHLGLFEQHRIVIFIGLCPRLKPVNIAKETSAPEEQEVERVSAVVVDSQLRVGLRGKGKNAESSINLLSVGLSCVSPDFLTLKGDSYTLNLRVYSRTHDLYADARLTELLIKWLTGDLT